MRVMTDKFLMYVDDGSGFSLRAKTVEQAHAKVSALVDAIAVDPLWEAELQLLEPCSAAMVEAIAGPDFMPNVAYRSGGPRLSVGRHEELTTGLGHVHGSMVAGVVARIGNPGAAGFRVERADPMVVSPEDAAFVLWAWQTKASDAGRRQAFLDVLFAHQSLVYPSKRWPGTYTEAATLRAVVTFALMEGGLSCTLMAHLEGKRSRLSMDVSYPAPDGVPSAGFFAFTDRLQAILGKFPQSRWRLVSTSPKTGKPVSHTVDLTTHRTS